MQSTSPFLAASTASRSVRRRAVKRDDNDAEDHRPESQSRQRSCRESRIWTRIFSRIQETGIADKILLGRVIDFGYFGKIYAAKYLGANIAVKEFYGADCIGANDEEADDGEEEGAATWHIDRDLENLQKKQSIHILRIISFVPENHWLLLEYCANGSLYNFLRKDSNRTIVHDWNNRLRWMQQVALGMYIAHEEYPTVLHRDLTTNNIFLAESFDAKIANFGMSEITRESAVEDSTCFEGTVCLNWQPPEVLRARQYSKKSDVYSYGTILYELFTLQSPFGIPRSNTIGEIKVEYLTEGDDIWVVPDDRSTLPGIWHPCLESYLELILECCQLDPIKRPNFRSICSKLNAIRVAYADLSKAGDAATENPLPKTETKL